MSKSLFELSSESRSIREQLELLVDQETGEIPDSAIDALMENQIAVTDKLNGYLDFMSEIKSTVEICKEKIKSFNSKIKAIEAIDERMRHNVCVYMSDNNIKQIKADKTISCVDMKDKIEINENELPRDYFVDVVKWVPNKDAIETAVSGGIEIKGVTIITNRKSVRIR